MLNTQYSASEDVNDNQHNSRRWQHLKFSLLITTCVLAIHTQLCCTCHAKSKQNWKKHNSKIKSQHKI